jgi:hypothetical protein
LFKHGLVTSRDCVARQGINETEALEKWVEAKSVEFVKQRAYVCRKI